MKHFRYLHLEDYLEKAAAYPDPKTVKIVSLKEKVIYAVINLHSSCIDFRAECIKDQDAKLMQKALIDVGHKEGTVIESAPVRF